MVLLLSQKHLFSLSARVGFVCPSVLLWYQLPGSPAPVCWKTNLTVHLMVSCGCQASLNALVSARSLAVPAAPPPYKSFILIFLSFEPMLSAIFDVLLLTFMAQFFLLHCEDICDVICSLHSCALLKLLYKFHTLPFL